MVGGFRDFPVYDPKLVHAKLAYLLFILLRECTSGANYFQQRLDKRPPDREKIRTNSLYYVTTTQFNKHNI